MSENLFRGQLIRLTAPRPEDAEIMARWSEDSDFLRLLDTDFARPKPARAFEDKTDPNAECRNVLEFRIRTVAEDRLVGFVAIHSIEWNNQAGVLSIGIGDPADWNRGYGSEAMQMILRYAFDELNLYRVGLNTLSYNERAIRVYEKAGFIREGAQRSYGQRDGRRYDLVLMSILQDEWRARK